MASFVIREISDATWRKVKSKAALEERLIKEIAVELFTEYAETPARKPRKKE